MANRAACGSVLILGLILLGDARAQEPAPEADYVGDEVCAACHAGLLEAYNETTHARVFASGASRLAAKNTTCEGCHGPGSLHVASGGGPAGDLLTFRSEGDEARAREDANCLGCHAGSERTYWHGSSHDSADVGCADCHTVMKKVSSDHLLSAKDEMTACGSCHPVSRSQMFRNSHMPVRQGKMSCGSCHNAHGTIASGLISDHTVNDNCYRCHAEKRGPFLWEHAPVYEDCLSCHDAHGTTRGSMLRSGVPRLCQDCHTSGHPASARTPDDRFVIGSSCLQCHQTIHGSNHPSGKGLTR